MLMTAVVKVDAGEHLQFTPEGVPPPQVSYRHSGTLVNA